MIVLDNTEAQEIRAIVKSLSNSKVKKLLMTRLQKYEDFFKYPERYPMEFKSIKKKRQYIQCVVNDCFDKTVMHFGENPIYNKDKRNKKLTELNNVLRFVVLDRLRRANVPEDSDYIASLLGTTRTPLTKSKKKVEELLLTSPTFRNFYSQYIIDCLFIEFRVQ